MLKYILFQGIIYFNYFIIFYVLFMSAINIIQLLLSTFYTPSYLRKMQYSDFKRFQSSPNMIPISLLVPACNEAETIVSNIKSMLSLNYSTYEIIVINDGSKDNTLENVIKAFNLEKITYPYRSQVKYQPIKAIYFNPAYPNLYLIDKENGGKADALNAGLNLSRYPYFVSVDADSLLESDALVRIALSFMEYKHVIAVGGIVRVVNGCHVKDGKVIKYDIPKRTIERFQLTEYFRAFLVGRMGFSMLNALPIISGAFGAFKKDVVIKIGGYAVDTVGEDMELVLRMHEYMRRMKYKYRITFLPDPICWTQVPDKVRVLMGQRRRWQVGLLDSISRHKYMLFNPKYGVVGMLSLPYYFIFELLGPIIEVIGIISIPLSYYFGLLSFEYFLLFFLATIAFGVILSIGALAIEEHTFDRFVGLKDTFLLSFYAIAENFSYRQLTLIFRIMGMLGYSRYKHRWGNIKRSRFESSHKLSEGENKGEL